jgi:L-aspartate oxidase
LLDVGYLILRSALFREESRGGHYRRDCLETLVDWRVHSVVVGDRWWRSDVIEGEGAVVPTGNAP